MLSSKPKQLGFSLLELLLVLVIVISFILASVSQFQSGRKKTDIKQVEYSVNTLLIGINGYYQQRCAQQRLVSNPSLANILNNNNSATGPLFTQIAAFLPNTIKIRNPYSASQFTVSYEQKAGSNPPVVVLKVSGNFDYIPAASIPTYAALWGATSHKGQTIVWERLPGEVSSVSQPLWVLDKELRSFTLFEQLAAPTSSGGATNPPVCP